MIGLIVLLMLATPWVFPGAKSLSVAAKIAIFVVLVASYDLLLGYTGIVSFAHTMFFGIGAYGVAIASTRMGPSWSALLVGTVAALALSNLLALVIGLFSLRVRAIFFAMITLAVATAFQTLASQLSEWTGGEDGLSFKLPDVLQPSFVLVEESVLGAAIDGRILSYYLVLGVAAILFLVMLRIVNSPFGRVLLAIRENPFRADALGYPTVVYRTISNLLAANFATLAGVLLSIWLRYNGPDTSLSFEIMLDILLMVVIGGMGTLYGAIIGATVFLLAQSYLQDMLKFASNSLESIPIAAALFSPDRWLLWLGVLFVLSVYYFPSGILGRLRVFSANRRNTRA